MMPARVAHVVSIDEIASDAAERTVLPSGGAVLGIQVRGRIDGEDAPLSPAGVTGIQQHARRYAYAAGTATILVRFTMQGATCLGVPADDLRDRSVPLDALLPAAGIHRLRAQLAESATKHARLAQVEAWVRSLPYAHDAVVEHAATQLVAGAGDDAAVASVARHVGLSERQLERRFLARVGLTPKRYARLRRFERAMAMLGGTRSLTEVAYAAGYYDQSHFIREVRSFTGKPPSELAMSDPSKPRDARRRTLAP